MSTHGNFELCSSSSRAILIIELWRPLISLYFLSQMGIYLRFTVPNSESRPTHKVSAQKKLLWLAVI